MYLAQMTFNLPTDLNPSNIIPNLAVNAEGWIIGSAAVVAAFILAGAVFRGLTRRASDLVK